MRPPAFVILAVAVAGFLLGLLLALFVAALSSGPEDQDDPGPPAQVTVEKTVPVERTAEVTQLPPTGGRR